MVVAIRIYSSGAPEVMQLEEIALPSPGPGEVLLEQSAIGVNPLDVSQRKGAVAIALPSGLGLEGAGTVAAVGSGVSGLRAGDRVGYATGPLGAYASARLFPAERLVRLPDTLGEDAAASVLFKVSDSPVSGRTYGNHRGISKPRAGSTGRHSERHTHAPHLEKLRAGRCSRCACRPGAGTLARRDHPQPLIPERRHGDARQSAYG